MNEKRDEEFDGTVRNSTPPDDAILYSAHTLAATACDMEKVFYAAKGMIKDIDRVNAKCDDKDCSQCDSGTCDDHQAELLSILMDSKQRYKLSDAEHIEAYMIAYDKTIGLPVQPINAGCLDESGEMIIDEAFDVNSEDIFQAVNAAYMDREGMGDMEEVIIQGRNVKDRSIGLDRAIEIAINEDGIGSRNLIAYLLLYIRKQEAVLSTYAEEIRRLKSKR